MLSVVLNCRKYLRLPLESSQSIVRNVANRQLNRSELN